ncbi:MAG: hypothetical protein V8T12_01430 [Parabacteroides johnsonii]
MKSSGGGNQGSFFNWSINFSSTRPLYPYNEDGSYNNLQLAPPFMSNALFNPLNLINKTSIKTKADLVNVNGYFEYKPIKGLSLKATIGVQKR